MNFSCHITIESKQLSNQHKKESEAVDCFSVSLLKFSSCFGVEVEELNLSLNYKITCRAVLSILVLL